MKSLITELRQDEGILWGCSLFEGLKGNTAAKYTAAHYWAHVTEILASNSRPSPHDIRFLTFSSNYYIDISDLQHFKKFYKFSEYILLPQI